jgi:hypothetical protein
MHALVLPPVHDVQSCPSGITYCAWHCHNGAHDVLPSVWLPLLILAVMMYIPYGIGGGIYTA